MINTEYLEKIARAKWREYIDTVIDTANVKYKPDVNRKMPKGLRYKPESKEYLEYLGSQYGDPHTVYENWRTAINNPAINRKNGFAKYVAAENAFNKALENRLKTKELLTKFIKASLTGATLVGTGLAGYVAYNTYKKDQYTKNYIRE